MILKKCTGCEIEKSIDEFHKDKHQKDGHKFRCKSCCSTITKVNRVKLNAYSRNRRKNNVDKIRTYEKKYRENNKEKCLIKDRQYKEKNRDILNKKKRDKYAINPQKYTTMTVKWRANKRKEDPFFRLWDNNRLRIKAALRKNGYTKSSRTHELVGCTYDEFIKHIESQWEPWMNWENYGLYKKNTYNYGWDIDHIIPLSSVKTELEQVKLFHYTNLKPLCSKVNRDDKKDKTYSSEPYIT